MYRDHPWEMGSLILPESTRRALLYHSPLLEISLKARTPVLLKQSSPECTWFYSWGCVCSVAQSCLTLCKQLSGCSIHGIFQARILERVAISSSRESSQPRDQTSISCTCRQILYHWATREVILWGQITPNLGEGLWTQVDLCVPKDNAAEVVLWGNMTWSYFVLFYFYVFYFTLFHYFKGLHRKRKNREL